MAVQVFQSERGNHETNKHLLLTISMPLCLHTLWACLSKQPFTPDGLYPFYPGLDR